MAKKNLPVSLIKVLDAEQIINTTFRLEFFIFSFSDIFIEHRYNIKVVACMHTDYEMNDIKIELSKLALKTSEMQLKTGKSAQITFSSYIDK